MQSSKKLSNFTLTGWLPKSHDSFNNHVRLVTKNKHSVKTIWFAKEGQSGHHEIVSQEFFRLIIPGQPKTRRIDTGVQSEFVVASKDAGNFSSLADLTDSDLEKLLLHGNVRCFGMVSVVGLVVCERDLRKASLGTNAAIQVIKIDGDHTFYSLRHDSDPAKYAITHAVITELPLARHYAAYNWLDSRHADQNRPSPVLEKLRVNHAFITDVNRGSLRCLLLPDALIDEFGRSCIRENPAIGMVYANEIRQRIHQLRNALSHNRNFMNFVASVTAKQEIDAYWPYLFAFYTTKKNSLVQQANITKQDLLKQLAALRDFYAENSQEYALCTTEESTDATPVDVQTLYAMMPNLRVRHRNEYAYPTNETNIFLNALIKLLQSDQFVPLLELEKIIDLAFEHQLACFDDIYNLINSKLLCTVELFPLAFMRRCQTHLLGFIRATDLETAQTHADELEKFLEKYQSVFTDPGFLFDDHQARIPALNTAIGARINFLDDDELHNMDIAKFYTWARTNRQIAKVLFRFGFTVEKSIWLQVPASFVRDLCDVGVNFATFAVLDPIKQRISYRERLPTHYLISFLQHCFDQKPALPGEPETTLTRVALENFIAANQDELAIPEISNRPIAQHLVKMIKQLLEQSPLDGVSFIYDFYCNSDYPFGLFALRQTRSQLLPESITAPEARLKFCRYERLDALYPFHSIYASMHFIDQPYLRLLVELTPTTLLYREMIAALDYHFNVSRYPLRYFIINAAEDFASLQNAVATGIYNLIDLLDEIDSSRLLPPHLKLDLQMDCLCTSHISFENLSAEVLTDFHALYLFTKTILHAACAEDHMPELLRRCTHEDAALQTAYIAFVDILAVSLPENPVNNIKELFNALLMTLEAKELEQENKLQR